MNLKKIKSYQEFLTENNISDYNIKEFEYFMDKVMELSNSEILELKNDIIEISEDEEVNESISSFVKKLKHRFSKWIDDKLFSFLIDRKKKFYTEIADKLNIFDMTTLDDVLKFFPTMEMRSLYLAGGMDDAEDTGAGWRNVLEYEFEVNNPGKKNPKLGEIMIGDTKVRPSYVVDGEFLDMVLADSKVLDNFYDKPALFNPVRKEVDRNKDDKFDNAIARYKDKDFDPTIDKDPISFFQNTFSKSIEPDDEHLLRISDAVFVGYDSTVGAGTFGELQLLSMIRKPLFAWLINDYDNKPGTFKLWTIPHLSKVARTKEDMETLVKTILRY